MSDLTNAEKRNLEKLFDMSGGYVLNFSDRTFSDFVNDSTSKEIHDYRGRGSSKANKLRAFWTDEPNHVVAKLITDMITYLREYITPEPSVLDVCEKAAFRLAQSAPVMDIEVINPKIAEKDIAALAKSIRESVEKHEPEAALDRLHTYTIKYLRSICANRGIETDKEKPLHSLMGEYLKSLKNNNEIDSEMTERILKSSISILDAFNSVRNNQSMAHDNKFLNYSESMLIVNNIVSSIKFIESIESKNNRLVTFAQENDIPF
ncbi:MAG: abortive infection family protein [Bdellovibrionota bacterium]